MTNQELIQEAAVIRDERNQYANTAERVGTALVHMAEQLAAQAADVDKVESDVRGALTLAQLDNPLGFTTPAQWGLGLRGEQSYTFRLVAASGRCIGHVWLFNDADHYNNSNQAARVLEMVMCCATINAETGALTYDAINGSPRIYYRSYIAAATGGGSPDGGNPGLFKWSTWQEYRDYVSKPIKDALAALQQQHATDVAALQKQHATDVAGLQANIDAAVAAIPEGVLNLGMNANADTILSEAAKYAVASDPFKAVITGQYMVGTAVQSIVIHQQVTKSSDGSGVCMQYVYKDKARYTRYINFNAAAKVTAVQGLQPDGVRDLYYTDTGFIGQRDAWGTQVGSGFSLPNKNDLREGTPTATSVPLVLTKSIKDTVTCNLGAATTARAGVMTAEQVEQLADAKEKVASVSIMDVQINGKPSISDVATITSPGWTKKPFDKVIPQGSVITAISGSQLYLYDIEQTSLGGVITSSILPYTVERDVHYATCSPTSKLSVTYEIEAVKGIVDELVDINSAITNNTDDISELNGSAYKPEVIEYASIDSSYQIIKASNRYDRVTKIKCKPNTRYIVSCDGQFNTAVGVARVVFYDKDGLLISGQEVLTKTYVRGLKGRGFVSPDGAEYFIVSLTNTSNPFTAVSVRCDEYDKINNRDDVNTLSVWVLGDSISATAYQTSVYPYQTNAKDSYGVGGWISMFMQKTTKRPLKWYNFARGGWFLGGNANSGTKSFSRELETAIREYEAGTIDAPDVILSVGCTNDFDYTTHQVTDEEITEGMTYDEYMEEQFVTTMSNGKRILKPIENVNTEKLAGAMRYIVQRAGTLFPNCKFVFCTPSQSTLHNPINQMRCVREMKWMANRLCVPIIDVWTEAQMPMLWDYYDEDGTVHHRFLDDRVHTYNTGNGSNAIGWQRQGEYIARRFSEILKDDMGLNY